MAQRKRNSGKIRDLELVAGVVDVTNATADYPLSVNETAKISITAASTPLNIAVVEGVYEIEISWDIATFGASQSVALQANNTTFAGQFNYSVLIGSTSIATDEVDMVDTTSNRHIIAGTLSSIPEYASFRLIIRGTTSRLLGKYIGRDAGVAQIHIVSSCWNQATAHTSLGTLTIGEAATGVCYVKRIA